MHLLLGFSSDDILTVNRIRPWTTIDHSRLGTTYLSRPLEREFKEKYINLIRSEQILYDQIGMYHFP